MMWAKHFKLRIRLEELDFLRKRTHFSSLETVREKSEMRELLSAFFDDPRSSVDLNSSGQ